MNDAPKFDCGATGVSPVQPGGDAQPSNFCSENTE
jgi:hypothetical protein